MPVESLFQIALNLIATNIHLLDSLHGFPDTVGKEIFLEAVSRKQFTNLRNRYAALMGLKIFMDAYGCCGILDSLSLKERHLFVNDTVEDSWWLYEHLTQLDLTSCGLGDDHELIGHLHKAHRLISLNLRNNSLSDEGVRKLTVRARMYAERSAVLNLKHLGLSDNEKITLKSLGFLQIYHQLEVLDVSNTSCAHQFKRGPERFFRFQDHTMCPCHQSYFCIVTSGWATDVIGSWQQEYLNAKHKPVTASSSSSSITTSTTHSRNETASSYTAKGPYHFYSRRKPPEGKKSSKTDMTVQHPAQDRTILVTNLFRCSHNKTPSLVSDVDDFMRGESSSKVAVTAESILNNRQPLYTTEDTKRTTFKEHMDSKSNSVSSVLKENITIVKDTPKEISKQQASSSLSSSSKLSNSSVPCGRQIHVPAFKKSTFSSGKYICTNFSEARNEQSMCGDSRSRRTSKEPLFPDHILDPNALLSQYIGNSPKRKKTKSLEQLYQF